MIGLHYAKISQLKSENKLRPGPMYDMKYHDMKYMIRKRI